MELTRAKKDREDDEREGGEGERRRAEKAIARDSSSASAIAPRYLCSHKPLLCKASPIGSPFFFFV